MTTEDRTDCAAARWFPVERGPVFVMGNAGSLFTRHLASLWRSFGIDARLVTRRWHGERTVGDGIPVLVATDSESPVRHAAYDWIERGMRQFESRLVAMQRERYAAAMGTETSYRPFVSPGFSDALGLAHLVRTLRPQFICGQEVFSYGLATAFSRGIPRVLMPWGGDVYMYSETSSLASTAVRYALTHVDLVVPGSRLAVEYLHERFGVPLDRMHVGGLWMLDRQRFRRAHAGERDRICEQFGIDPTALIVMSIRRFFPAWGSDLTMRAFLRFADEHPDSHFVLLGGVGTEPFVEEARQAVAQKGFARRFTFFNGDVPLDDCASLMSVADISVSLMRERDMSPFASILEAAACGSSLVLGDQPEYQQMVPHGFSALFCQPENEDAPVDAMRRYAGDRCLRQEMADRNRIYLDEHEDGRKQAMELLQRIRTVCDNYERG